MIKFFRRIRQRLVSENRFSKYLLYAIGEIVLVVFGILIALQINNTNEIRKEREREVNYLKNLKADLISELKSNDQFISYRFNKAKKCAQLLAAEAPKTIDDVKAYTDAYETVFVWGEFVPNNNTFKELLSSGNLSLLSNDSIKNKLLELEKLYANIKSGENHMRREYEAYLYDPHVTNITSLAFFDLTQPYYGDPKRITVADIPESRHAQLIKDANWQHTNAVFTNGLRLAQMNNGFLAGKHQTLGNFIQELIDLIEREIDT